MNQNQRLNWERIREKGKRHYVLVNGIKAAILSIAAAALAVIFVKTLLLNDSRHDPSGGIIPLVTVFVGTMVGTFAGICIGATRTWDIREKEFKKQEGDTPAAT